VASGVGMPLGERGKTTIRSQHADKLFIIVID